MKKISFIKFILNRSYGIIERQQIDLPVLFLEGIVKNQRIDSANIRFDRARMNHKNRAISNRVNKK